MTCSLITTIGLYFVSRLSSAQQVRDHDRQGLSGRENRPRPWRWFAAAIFIAYFLLIVVLPFAVLLWSSFRGSTRYFPGRRCTTSLSTSVSSSATEPLRSVWNTLSFLRSATLIMLVTSVICWIVEPRLPALAPRQRRSLPMVFPGLVLGLSIMIFYLNSHRHLRTIWIMFIAYVTRFMPYACATTRLRCCRSKGARGIGGNERRLLGHDVSPHHPAALEARARRG